MKKYLFFILVIALLVLLAPQTKLGSIGENNKYYVQNQNECFGYFDVVDAKTQTIVDCGKVIGEFTTINKKDLNRAIDKLKIFITKKYYVDDRLIIEGNSNYLPYKNKNQNFNVQIAVSGESAKIASPALLDSF